MGLHAQTNSSGSDGDAIPASDDVKGGDAQVDIAGETEPNADFLKAYKKLKRDPTPPQLVRDTHYWISNENRLDLFHVDIQDKGGVYIGVGTDQNYMLAAWSKPETMVLMDFDQAVVDLHLVYRALFLSSTTREAFLQAWKKKNKRATRKIIAAFYKQDPRSKKRAKWAFGQARWAVDRRIERVRTHMKKMGVETLFDNDEQFAFIQKLFREGRVFSLRGDLTSTTALRSIAKAVAAEQQVVRVLYLSNAEQYFTFDWKFRRNLSQLPLDDKSVVLRTSGLRSVARVPGTYYHYNVQSGLGFQTWMSLKRQRPKNAGVLLRYAEPAGSKGFSHLFLAPDEAKAARKERWKQAKAERRAKRKAKKKSPARRKTKRAKAKRRNKTKEKASTAPGAKG